MNKRIKEFVKQAGIELPNNLVEGVNGPGVVSPKDKLSKFAELIVRHCAMTAGLMENDGRKNIGAQILDNFGIKNE
jgi:hypothetical protein